MSQPIIQGVLAVHKPASITSNDVLYTLQRHFKSSKLFAPLIAQSAEAESQKQRGHRGRRSKQKATQVKIGHGGTLDPMATGVLLVGLGSGTKSLGTFLGCKKTYETVVAFGAWTDTQDVTGPVKGNTGWEGVSKEKIEQALAQFRGKIMQRPPIFSARHINGVRAYDLARRGEHIPEDALELKEVMVDEIELLEFWEEGQHEYVMRSGEELQSTSAKFRDENGGSKKRKRMVKESSAAEQPAKIVKTEALDYVKERPDQDPRDIKGEDELMMTGALPVPENKSTEPGHDVETKQEDETKTKSKEEAQIQQTKLGPAARIRMTVSSGFYVRSLCHDLGKALGSSGVMAELVRTAQSDFDLKKGNVLEYKMLDEGEDVWGPEVKRLLLEWQEK